MMASFVRRFGKRLIVTIGGEAAQSGLHFVLNLCLLSTQMVRDYGVFALVMIVGGVGVSYVRALTCMPASIWIGRSRGTRSAVIYDVVFGSVSLVLSVAVGLLVALLLQIWLNSDALTGGVFVSVWLLRSYLRTATFARADLLSAAVGDFVFISVGATLAALMVWWGGQHQLERTFALLAFANGSAMVATLAAARRPMRFSLRRSIWRRYMGFWRQLKWSLISVTTVNLQGQGFTFVVAIMAGPAAYAPIAAILVLFVPLRVVEAGLTNMLQPELAHYVARGEREAIWRQARIWTLFVGCGIVSYGIAMALALRFYHPPVFEGVTLRALGFFAWAIYGASILRLLPRLVLEVAGVLRAIAVICGIGAVASIVSVAMILTVATPQWSLAGALVSEVIVLFGFWSMVSRTVERPCPALSWG
jgi:hypothetical protein